MANGYSGKILRVNLTRGAMSTEEPDEAFYRQYIGGRGMVSYYLLAEMTGGEDPLGPENKLVFANGPITGVPISGSGRNSVGAKSPLTNGYGDAEVGGYWGAELKHAGYDAVIIEGKAKSPVYLWIKDRQTEIRDAGHLWGKPTAECERLIQEELGDRGIRVAQIGVAGENQVRYACIINDLSHAAGRTGLGAVMGSKNLRAIAVRGRQKVPVADDAAVIDLIRWHREDLKTNKSALSFNKDGTAGIVMHLNEAGGLPTRNFRQGIFEGAEKLSAERINETILTGRRGCYACRVQCKPEVVLGEPYNLDATYGGPEYETLAALGSNCGVDDLEAVVRGNALCNAYGLDTISTGACIAFAMECFEQGIITGQDSGGLKLNFGNAEAMVELVEMIARRRGLGRVLADGVARAAAAIGNGAEKYALHIKRQEVPMHEPRYKPGLGVGYTVSPTGADHCHNVHDTMYSNRVSANLQVLGITEPIPAQELSAAKVRALAYGTIWQHTVNCLVWCDFVPMGIHKMIELVRGITGWNTSVWELMKAGERCITLTQVFNLREGMTKRDDALPRRFFKPFTSGPLKGASIKKKDLNMAIDTYYDMMGWNRRTGRPGLTKLQELGIEWAAEV